MEADPFAPLDRLGKRPRSRQGGVHQQMGARLASLLLIFVGIFTPLILFYNADSHYRKNIAATEREIAFAYTKRLSESVIVGYALTQGMEGYVMSRMRVLPNISLPPQERIAGQNFSGFADFAAMLFSRPSSIATAMLVPGGVYTDVYPPVHETFMRDMFDPSDYAQSFVPTPQDSVMNGDVAYLGPFHSNVGFMRGHWGLVVRRPVFNRTSYREAGWANFWGFTMTVLNVSAIIERRPFAATQLAHDARYRNVDYVVSVRHSVSSELQLIATSLLSPTAAELERFVAAGTSVNVTPNHPFTVTVRGRDYDKWLSADNVTIVVATVVGGSLLCVGIFSAFAIFCGGQYDGTPHAPKMAPFAMLTVGPCRGEELWELAPDEMADVTDRLGRVLARQMVRHRAYQIQQVHPLTVSYVTRSVAAAVQMAFDTIEELQSAPIDDALRRLLGDDGCLLLSYAVHWCSDAAVRLDAMSSGYRYEGPDVVYGGRMWAFAAPSVVTVSEAVADALPRFGLRCLAAEPYRRVHVVRSRSVCGATGDGAVMNGGGGSTSGAATIYVPYPAPTTVEATAGMGDGRPAVPLRQGRDEALPPRTLLTLIDERRPLLVAAREAAPPLHLHHHGGGGGPPHPASSRAASPLLAAGESGDFSPREQPLSPRWEAEVPSAFPAAHSVSSFQSSDDSSLAVAALSLPQPTTIGHDVGPSNLGTTAMLRSSQVVQGDGVTRVLLRPDIPHALDVALHVAFDYQAITLGMTYDSARVLVYYFYSSYKILFRPLAAPERHNIYRRLVTAFGVPQQGILEHLAARCAIRCLQQSAKLRQLGAQRRYPAAESPLPLASPLVGGKSVSRS